MGGRLHITGFDIRSEFARFDDGDKCRIIIGDQSDPVSLEQAASAGPFDVIIDDGYHASKHQQVTLNCLWDSVKPGGMFIVEDLHFQPEREPESCVKTKALLQAWASGDARGSEYITADRAAAILEQVSEIKFYDSESLLWGDAVKSALAVVHKNSIGGG